MLLRRNWAYNIEFVDFYHISLIYFRKYLAFKNSKVRLFQRCSELLLIEISWSQMPCWQSDSRYRITNGLQVWYTHWHRNRAPSSETAVKSLRESLVSAYCVHRGWKAMWFVPIQEMTSFIADGLPHWKNAWKRRGETSHETTAFWMRMRVGFHRTLVWLLL